MLVDDGTHRRDRQRATRMRAPRKDDAASTSISATASSFPVSSTRTRTRSTPATASPILRRELRGESPPLGMRYTIERTREALLDPAAFYERTIRAAPAHDAGARHDDARDEDGLRAAQVPARSRCSTSSRRIATIPASPRLIATFLGAHALPPEFNRARRGVRRLLDRSARARRRRRTAPSTPTRSASRDSSRPNRRAAISMRHACTACGCACTATRCPTAAPPRWPRSSTSTPSITATTFARSDVRAIAERGIVTVACPATIEFLGLPQRTPVRALLEAGGNGRAGQRLQSRHVAVLQPADRGLFRPQALRPIGGRGALRRNARGGALAARRCRASCASALRPISWRCSSSRLTSSAGSSAAISPLPSSKAA